MIIELDNKKVSKELEMWRYKAYCCPMRAEPGHDFIVTSRRVNESSEHASTLMCKLCFHIVTMNEIINNRHELVVSNKREDGGIIVAFSESDNTLQ